jgi:hypothetical protein
MRSFIVIPFTHRVVNSDAIAWSPVPVGYLDIPKQTALWLSSKRPSAIDLAQQASDSGSEWSCRI